MSKNEEILKSLKIYISNAQSSGLNSVVQLPIETALSIQKILKRQHSALKSAVILVETLKNNYNKDNSTVLIDEEDIIIIEVIIKASLT
jgi:hypothetical protein